MFIRYLGAIIALAMASIAPQNAFAQDILRDAQTEALLNDLARPLIVAAHLDPSDIKVILLNDREVNAFVAGGQTVYINAGLLLEADNAQQVQAVIAHELGHIAGGHAIDDRGMKKARGISLLSVAMGATAAAMGNGEAGVGIMMAGQQAALGSVLAYSRTEEEAADAAGARYLAQAGLSGKASIEFFHHLLILENQHGVTRTSNDQFWSTHPMTDDRIAMLEDTYRQDKAWNAPADEVANERFALVKAKLDGYLGEPEQTLAKYSGQDAPAHFARAYAYAAQGAIDSAIAEIDAITSPVDTAYVLESKGELLLEAGKGGLAQQPLGQANTRQSENPLIQTEYAHALILDDPTTSDPADVNTAAELLRRALIKDPANPDGWHLLGSIEASRGRDLEAKVCMAEEAMLLGKRAESRQIASDVLARALPGSRPAIEAQDILNQKG